MFVSGARFPFQTQREGLLFLLSPFPSLSFPFNIRHGSIQALFRASAHLPHMSRIIGSNSFTSRTADFAGDELHFTSTLNVETSPLNVAHNIHPHPTFPYDVLRSVGGMPGYQYDPVQDVQVCLACHILLPTINPLADFPYGWSRSRE